MEITAPFAAAAAWDVLSSRAGVAFMRASFVAQRLRRVDGGGAARGEIGGEEPDHAEDARGDQADGGGEGRLAEELQGLVPVRGDEAEPDDDEGRHQETEQPAQ